MSKGNRGAVVTDALQNVGYAVSGTVQDAAEAVRERAEPTLDTATTAVTAAIDSVVASGRRARKRAAAELDRRQAAAEKARAQATKQATRRAGRARAGAVDQVDGAKARVADKAIEVRGRAAKRAAKARAQAEKVAVVQAEAARKLAAERAHAARKATSKRAAKAKGKAAVYLTDLADSTHGGIVGLADGAHDRAVAALGTGKKKRSKVKLLGLLALVGAAVAGARTLTGNKSATSTSYTPAPTPAKPAEVNKPAEQIAPPPVAIVPDPEPTEAVEDGTTAEERVIEGGAKSTESRDPDAG